MQDALFTGSPISEGTTPAAARAAQAAAAATKGSWHRVGLARNNRCRGVMMDACCRNVGKVLGCGEELPRKGEKQMWVLAAGGREGRSGHPQHAFTRRESELRGKTMNAMNETPEGCAEEGGGGWRCPEAAAAAPHCLVWLAPRGQAKRSWGSLSAYRKK